VALAVAGWMRYVSGIDETGGTIDVRDPMAALLRERIDAAGPDPMSRVRALVGVEAIFGKDLPASEAFMTAVTTAYEQLGREGARKAIADRSSSPVTG
jgi:fructuronate reductase